MNTKRLFLEFTEEVVIKTVTCQLIKNYNIEVNILNANINYNQIGYIVIDIMGDNEEIDRALLFLKENKVGYKFLSNSVIRDDNKCIHCGACSGICPTRAIVYDEKEALISFSNEKCILCKLCIKACPLRAIDIGAWQ